MGGDGGMVIMWVLLLQEEIHVTKYDNEIYDYDVINGAPLKREKERNVIRKWIGSSRAVTTKQ